VIFEWSRPNLGRIMHTNLENATVVSTKFVSICSVLCPGHVLTLFEEIIEFEA
jgi:hypothetical protein